MEKQMKAKYAVNQMVHVYIPGQTNQAGVIKELLYRSWGVDYIVQFAGSDVTQVVTEDQLISA